MIPLVIAGLASVAGSMIASSQQAQAQKKAADAAARNATPGQQQSGTRGTGWDPSRFGLQGTAGQEQQPAQAPIAAQAPQPAPSFVPTQVLTAPAWDAQAPRGGAAMEAPQNRALENNWASDYSRAMAGSGAPSSPRRPSIADSWGAL